MKMNKEEKHDCKEHAEVIFKWSRYEQQDEPYIDKCKICGSVVYEYGGQF